MVPGLLLCAVGLLLSGPSPLLGFDLSYKYARLHVSLFARINVYHTVHYVLLCHYRTSSVYIKEYMSDSFTNYNYVGNTKVSVSIKKNLCQQMHIKRDISN